MQIAPPDARALSFAAAGVLPGSRPDVSLPADIGPASASGIVEPERLKQAAEVLTQVAGQFANNLQFTVDKDTGKDVVKVVDTETHEVVRQIPPEETLARAKALNHLAGLLMREKA